MRPVLFFFCLLLVSSCGATNSATGKAGILPLRTLRLYETGVGYFSRAGKLDGSSSTWLPVPASHLDDALKTLVVLSGDRKSQIQGLEFSSALSRGMARAMAGLPQDSTSELGWRDLLVSLRGAAVELRTDSEQVRGRVVDVTKPAQPSAEIKEKTDDEAAPPPTAGAAGEFQLLLLGERGELRRFSSRSLRAVRPLDAAFVPRLDSALDALSTRAAQTEHAVRLLASSSGPVTIGYIAEAPLFRTTWRLVVDAAGKAATLVGWALLHNDTDEDWKKVTVELVNGQPDSFLFPLAAPRYARRELIHPEAELSTVPQLLDKSPDSIWGDHIDDMAGIGGLGLVGSGRGGGGIGSGYGSGLGRIGTIGHGGGSGTGASNLLEVGNLAGVAAAKGIEAGALFTYTLASALDLHGHGSALVPFMQESVEADSITWLTDEHATPRTAIRFVNSTHQTLPTGPMAFFETGGFSGEATLERLKPGERRFLQYGNDLDLDLRLSSSSQTEVVKKVRFKNDRLEQHYLRTRSLVYAIENRSGQKKSVYLGLLLEANAKVTGADRLDYDTTDKRPIAIFDVAARQKPERAVTTVEGMVRYTAVDGLHAAELDVLALLPDVTPQEREKLVEAARLQREMDALRVTADKTKKEMTEVEGDLKRLREHLAALAEKGGTAANPFVQRILAAEDRLTSLRHQAEATAPAIKAILGSLKNVLEKI